ncbi:hypothetical protein ACOME3_010353 [Neoechinorhynchus agilis]
MMRRRGQPTILLSQIILRDSQQHNSKQFNLREHLLCYFVDRGRTRNKLHIEHLRAQHNTVVAAWQCPLCDNYEHIESRSVGIHLRRCKEKYPNRYRQLMTEASTKSPHSERRDSVSIMYSNIDDTPARCPACQLSLLGIGRYNSIMAHAKSSHGAKTITFLCCNCLKSFRNLPAVRSHCNQCSLAITKDGDAPTPPSVSVGITETTDETIGPLLAADPLSVSSVDTIDSHRTDLSMEDSKACLLSTAASSKVAEIPAFCNREGTLISDSDDHEDSRLCQTMFPDSYNTRNQPSEVSIQVANPYNCSNGTGFYDTTRSKSLDSCVFSQNMSDLSAGSFTTAEALEF